MGGERETCELPLKRPKSPPRLRGGEERRRRGGGEEEERGRGEEEERRRGEEEERRRGEGEGRETVRVEKVAHTRDTHLTWPWLGKLSAISPVRGEANVVWSSRALTPHPASMRLRGLWCGLSRRLSPL